MINYYNAILNPGALIRIKAPEKTGKTQLMNKILRYAKEKNYQTLVLDMSVINLTDLKVFSRQFCNIIGNKLSLPNELDSYWNEDLSCNFLL